MTETYLLEIQNDSDIIQAKRILEGVVEVSEETILQFRERARDAIGDKGDEAIQVLAPLIKSCQVHGLILRFVFSNLSPTSEELLADALASNSYLVGFTCIQNPHNFDSEEYYYNPTASVQRLEDAAVHCPSPYLTIFQNEELSADLKKQRARFISTKTLPVDNILPPQNSTLSSDGAASKPVVTENTIEESLLTDEQALNSFLEVAKKGEGVAPWQRSKLMMVGQGRAGKSSTVRSFVGDAFEPNLKSTIGADTGAIVTVDRQDIRAVKDKTWAKRNSKEAEYFEMAARVAAKKKKSPNEDSQNDDEVLTMEDLKEKLPEFIENHLVKEKSTAEETSSSRRPSLSSKFLTTVRRMSFKSSPAPTTTTPDSTPVTASLPIKLESKPIFDDDQDLIKQFDAMLASPDLDVNSNENKVTLSIWDYGGQEVFYALHHLFLTQYGIYCVVFNMADIIGNNFTAESQKQALVSLLFWTRSIRMHAANAPMVLVGTHKDQVSSLADHLKINKILIEKLGVNSQLVPYVISKNECLSFFPIDNSAAKGKDPVLDLLRRIIIEAVQDKDYVKLNVPISWMRALDILLEKRKTCPYVSLDEVAEICQEQVGGRIQNITKMLNFFHQLGVLCYFDSCVDLRQLVVLDPQWIVDNLTKIIRDFDLHSHDILMTDDLALRAKFAKDYDNLKRRGILSEGLLRHQLWRDVGEVQQTFLLALMKNMSLLSEWKAETASSGEIVIQYLVPSLLDSTVSSSPEEDEAFNANVPELVFDLDFRAFFLPHGLFPRLVALIVSHTSTMFEYSCTPILTKKKSLLSFGLAVFSLELLDEQDIIRVGIMDKQEALFIRAVLASMVEKLQDEVMGKSLKWSIVFHVPTSKGTIVRVSLDEIQEATKKKMKKVFGLNKVRVELEETKIFFERNENNEKEQEEAPNLVSNRYHTFLSYYQATAMDQVSTLYGLLTNEQFKVWFDQRHEGQLTEPAMMEGVSDSVCLLVFLSKSVFTREACLKEIRKALELKKPIMFVHEADSRSIGNVDFYELRSEAPDDILPLLSNVESIPYRRRKFEADAMIHELVKRMKGYC